MTAARSELPARIHVPDRVNAADFFLDRHVREGRAGWRRPSAMPGAAWPTARWRSGRAARDTRSRDTDGYSCFCGRADDMLKVGGMWVAPAEVEACWLEHPAMLEIGVIGRRDVGGLTKPHAFCVLKLGVTSTPGLPEALTLMVRARLAGYRPPRRVEVVPQLPKTPTGKSQRFRLRDGA